MAATNAFDADQFVGRIRDHCGRIPAERIQLMEVCGTHTVAIFKNGIRSLLPKKVRLISGPGCPVCVTSGSYVDAAIELAARPGVVIATFGDMVRVPGSHGSLAEARARGADVRVVYSPQQAVEMAEADARTKVVFLAVGFETTTPGVACSIIEAERRKLANFHVLAAHKRIMPAMHGLAGGGEINIDGFLCPGHVSVITGWRPYEELVERYRIPCVVAGFTAPQILAGLTELLGLIASGRPEVRNVYEACVSRDGNAAAQRAIDEVFEVSDAGWRGIGVIPQSGLAVRDRYKDFDAARVFGVVFKDDQMPAGCSCGKVIKGVLEPTECPLFAKQCTPVQPVGPCMVSQEGSCKAYYEYARRGASR